MTQGVRRRVVLAGTGGVLLTTACNRVAPHAPGAGPHATPVRYAPAGGPIVVTGSPSMTSVAMSRAVFASSPVAVVLAPSDAAEDRAARDRAVALGVPLLVLGEADVAAELDRLGVLRVVAHGIPQRGWDRVLDDRILMSDAAAPGRGQVAQPDDGSVGGATPLLSGPPLPESPAPVIVLVGADGSRHAAARATARAARAQVLPLPGGDPRATTEVLHALRSSPDAQVVGLGDGFGSAAVFTRRMRMAVTAPELPGGGVLVFPARRLVALYGHPGTGALGVLGEQGPQGSVERARELAAAYEPHSDEAVVPAWEIIATVADSAAGTDGDYSAESALTELRPWVDAAEDAGIYVVLDLQPGRTDFLTQAQRYRELLERPHVGLALDPEWRLGPGEHHLVRIGSVGIDEVNRVVTWLADLVTEEGLPQKVLTLHQFRTDMIRDRERLDTSRDELAVVIHADGQGSQPAKQATWRTLRKDLPSGVWLGWKNFYDEDIPVLTPAETMTLVRPTPWFISYQ